MWLDNGIQGSKLDCHWTLSASQEALLLAHIAPARYETVVIFNWAGRWGLCIWISLHQNSALHNVILKQRESENIKCRGIYTFNRRV